MPLTLNGPLIIGAGVLLTACAVAMADAGGGAGDVILSVIRIPFDLVMGTAHLSVSATRTIMIGTTSAITALITWRAMNFVSVKMGWRQAEEAPPVKKTLSRVGIPSGDAQWINTILAEVWPKITEYLEGALRESIEQSIQAAVPVGGSSIYFQEIGVGTIPMRFENMHTRVLTRQSLEGERKMLQLCLDFIYEGDMKIVLSAFGAKVGFSNLMLDGMMVIDFPQLLPVPPFFSGMNFYFPTKPQISMDWEGLAAVASDPMFAKRVSDVIEHQVSSRLVLPYRIANIMGARDQTEKFRVLKPRPHGVLKIKVKEAKKLKAADSSLLSLGKLTSSDPFVMVEVGAESWQTNTISQNLNPVWTDQVHNFFVDYPLMQAISFVVYDEDRFSSADVLGRCTLTVEEMVCRDADVPLMLKDDEGEGNNSCAGLGSELYVEATYLPLVLDAGLSSSITSGSSEPTCMLFVGIGSVYGLPAAEPGTKHWCEVSVSDHGKADFKWKTPQVEVAKKEAVEEEHKKKKLQRKIDRLEEAKVDKKIITDVLEIREESNLDESGDITTAFDDGFFHLMHDPTQASVTLEMKQEAVKLVKGSKTTVTSTVGKQMNFQVKELLESKDNTQSQRSFYFGPKDETQALVTFLQLRMLGEPKKDLFFDQATGDASPTCDM